MVSQYCQNYYRYKTVAGAQVSACSGNRRDEHLLSDSKHGKWPISISIDYVATPIWKALTWKVIALGRFLCEMAPASWRDWTRCTSQSGARIT